MFSGIIERLGTVRDVVRTPSEQTLTLDTGIPDLTLGESVAVNGVCLTVTHRTPEGEAQFHVSPETLARTALSRLRQGAQVNLERAITPASRLSGHIVQGHVDGVGQLTSIEQVGECFRLVVMVPTNLRRYVVEKGSIALDGISLTVNAVGAVGESFPIHLMIIPHTWTHTGLGSLVAGDPLNIEVDVLAKYVETLLAYPPSTAHVGSTARC
jgi:riboflavin synthase